VIDPCAPTSEFAIAFYDVRRLLLLLHAAGAIVLIGSSTHHALQMRHYFRGDFAKMKLEKIYAKVVSVAYPVTFLLGAILYPTYRYHVRALFLDRYAHWAARLFDVKEVFASLALVVAIGLGALAFTLEPKEEPHLARVYATMSLIVCGVVWLDVVAGVIVTGVRGIG
jgi:hypothetical protein